jgi:hypothetical protein
MSSRSDKVKKLLTIVFVLAAMTLLLEAPALAQGCSMCRSALESSPEGRVLAGSFAKGILMILVLPYAIAGTFGFAIYRAFRKKSKMEV